MMKAVFLLLLVGACLVAFFHSRRRRQVDSTFADPSSLPSLPRPDPDRLQIRGFEFYVRLEDGREDAIVEAIEAAAGTRGVVYRRRGWAVVLWDDVYAPEAVLRALSEEEQLEIIWLSFQKQVDAFEFWRWLKGAPQRRITFGCYENERTWEHVEGQPEAWEAAAIFADKDLAFELEMLSEHPPEDKAPAEAEAELRSVWRDRTLRVGADVPNIAGRDVAEAAAVAYGLPGWE